MTRDVIGDVLGFFPNYQIIAQKAVVVSACWMFGIACTPKFEGEYSDPAKAEIVDDRWNETDARKTAEVMVSKILQGVWLKNYVQSHKGNRPVVVVDDIQNRTDEHLDMQALTEAIQSELINSGKVRFVNKAQRKKLLEEIKYQQSGNVSKKSAKQTGRQTGADYMLGGAISASVHSMDDLKTVTYQTVLNLTNIETFEVDWIEKHQIKKRFRRSGSGW